jgi:hypothetical protein
MPDKVTFCKRDADPPPKNPLGRTGASPQCLNLEILCTHRTLVRKRLGVRPAFPISINYHHFYSKSRTTPNDEDNIVAALDSENLHSLCFVGLCVTGPQLGEIATVMQEPFPVLTCLDMLGDRDAKMIWRQHTCASKCHFHTKRGGAILSTEVKYFKQNIADSFCLSITLACVTKSQYSLQS